MPTALSAVLKYLISTPDEIIFSIIKLSGEISEFKMKISTKTAVKIAIKTEYSLLYGRNITQKMVLIIQMITILKISILKPKQIFYCCEKVGNGVYHH